MDLPKIELEIVLAAYKYHAAEVHDTPDVTLKDKYPQDVIIKTMERMVKDGYLAMGAILRNAWPTERGLRLIEGLPEPRSRRAGDEPPTSNTGHL